VKTLSYICRILALITSHVACAVVAYNYRGMQCGIEHLGFSAPAEVALFYIIPFILVITILMSLSWYFTKRSRKKEKNRDAKISS
jgi:hypothetical protein